MSVEENKTTRRFTSAHRAAIAIGCAALVFLLVGESEDRHYRKGAL
jgi:hypothetical protein